MAEIAVEFERQREREVEEQRVWAAIGDARKSQVRCLTCIKFAGLGLRKTANVNRIASWIYTS